MDTVQNHDRTFLGTKVKYLLEVTSPGFSMQDDDFEIELSRGDVSKTFHKADLINHDDQFLICFNTADFGPGVIKAKVTAFVPDADFDDGIRTEVYKFDITPVDR